MNIEFLSTVAVIAPDPPASRRLYVDALGLPLRAKGTTINTASASSAASRSASGRCPRRLRHASERPELAMERPVPQVSIEFDVPEGRGGGSGDTGARASWLRAAAPTARGAVGSNGGQAAITGGCDRRDLVRPRPAQSGVTRESDDEPSLSTSGETLTIEESMNLEGENGERRDVGDEHEWSRGCG